MFRSVWYANMDCMVGNIQYLQDDDSEPEQRDLASESYKSSQPEFGHKYYDDIGYRTSTRHKCACTGDCDCDRNIYVKLDDSIKCNTELYTKLSK